MKFLKSVHNNYTAATFFFNLGESLLADNINQSVSLTENYYNDGLKNIIIFKKTIFNFYTLFSSHKLFIRFFFFKSLFFSKGIYLFLQNKNVVSFMKHGLRLKLLTFLNNVHYRFFFLFSKHAAQNFNNFLLDYNYYSFIRSYFLSNANSMISINTFYFWLCDFLDINFWVKCSKKKKVFVTTTKILKNESVKLRTTFKLLYIESVFTAGRSFLSRYLNSLLDTTFNYKKSSLYKKKILMYKKIFKN